MTEAARQCLVYTVKRQQVAAQRPRPRFNALSSVCKYKNVLC
jgi:hypothetical protein